MLRYLIVPILAIAATSQDARGETIVGSSFGYGNWLGSAYTNDQTGEFSHCAVSAPFVSGDTLLFSVNRQGTVSVGVSNPDFGFGPGQRFPVSIFVDRRAPFYGVAEAISSDFAALEIRDFERALTAFKKGRQMRIETPNGEGRYDLSGTFRALEKATQCAYNYYRYTDRPRYDPNEDMAIDKTVLFQVATETINELGIDSFRFLSIAELREAGSSEDAVRWVSEAYGIEGAALLAPGSGLTSLKDTDGLDAQYIADACDGDFATSARQIDFVQADARELRAICTTGDRVKETYVTKILLDGTVLYTVLSFVSGEHEPLDADRQVASERAAIRAASFLLE